MSKTLIIGTVAVVVLFVLGSGVFWWQVFQSASVPELPEEKIAEEQQGANVALPGDEAGAAQLEQELSIKVAAEEPLVAKIGPGKIQQATFVATWGDAVVINLSLVPPDGKIISEDTVSTTLPGGTVTNAERTDPKVYHDKGPRHELYRIDDPQTGEWEIRLFNASVPSGGTKVTVEMSQIPEDLEPHVSASLHPISAMVSGDTAELLVTFSHPGRDRKPHTATIDWGDGTIEPGEITSTGHIGTFRSTHVYREVGTYAIKVCVVDVYGRPGCDTAQAEVALSAPSIQSFSIGEGAVLGEYGDISFVLGEEFEIVVEYTSPGPQGEHEAIVFWHVNDENPIVQKVGIEEWDGGGIVRVRHMFSEPALYGFYMGSLCISYPGSLPPQQYNPGCTEFTLTYEGGSEF